MSFKQTVNDLLRRGLVDMETPRELSAFNVQPLDVSGLREGLSYDNVEELLDQLHGPNRR